MTDPAMIEEIACSYAWIMDTEAFERDTAISQIPGYIRGRDETLALFLLKVGVMAKYAPKEDLNELTRCSYSSPREVQL
jgi:hypothetical protein